MERVDIELGGYTSLSLGFSDNLVQLKLERHEKIQNTRSRFGVLVSHLKA